MGACHKDVLAEIATLRKLRGTVCAQLSFLQEKLRKKPRRSQKSQAKLSLTEAQELFSKLKSEYKEKLQALATVQATSQELRHRIIAKRGRLHRTKNDATLLVAKRFQGGNA